MRSKAPTMPHLIGGRAPGPSVPDVQTPPSVVGVEASYFSVEDGAALFDAEAAGHADSGLVGRTRRSAVITTGVEFGSVQVAVQAWHGGHWPGVPDLSDWDDVVEVPLVSETGKIMVFSPLEEIEPPLPILSLDGPGVYRLRVHVRGRDADRQRNAEVGDEMFLLQAWPSLSLVDADLVMRLTDQTGLGVRQSLIEWRHATAVAQAAARVAEGPQQV